MPIYTQMLVIGGIVNSVMIATIANTPSGASMTNCVPKLIYSVTSLRTNPMIINTVSVIQ
jgi:hypothetical protein